MAFAFFCFVVVPCISQDHRVQMPHGALSYIILYYSCTALYNQTCCISHAFKKDTVTKRRESKAEYSRIQLQHRDRERTFAFFNFFTLSCAPKSSLPKIDLRSLADTLAEKEVGGAP